MRVLIVDAYNMIHRARFGYAVGDHAITYNFFRSLKSEFVRHMPDKVYIVSEGRPIHRLALNEDYKGQRKPIQDSGFHRQKKEIFDLCSLLPITFIRHNEYECDDVIGYLCTNADEKDVTTIISSDTDFIQLLELDNVSLWNPVKKKFIEKWPVDYVVWKSLKGDPTDNVPGVRGIGTKKAFSLAADVSILDKMLNENPEKKAVYESAYQQILLAHIEKDQPGWEIKNFTFNENQLFSAFTQCGFSSITGKAWEGWKQTMEKLNNVRTTSPSD